MKARIYQLQVQPGLPGENAQKMLAAIEQAKQAKAHLIIFPEMAIPGYLLGDEWERNAFLRECEACGERIREAAKGITVIFGNIAVDWHRKNEDGRVRKYNALFVAENGAFIDHPHTKNPFFIKMLMPNYGQFDDNRYFFDASKLAYELNLEPKQLIEPVPSVLGKLGCLLCEDGWSDDYNISPCAILATKGAELFINISSSPYTLNKRSKRNRLFAAHAKQHGRPLLYVNNTGLQDNGKTVYTFDGSSCAYDANGSVMAQLMPYKEAWLDVNTKNASTGVMPILSDAIDAQYEAILYGTQQFMARLGVTKVVVGVSGGIDSALVASIYHQLVQPQDLLLVSMPGPFTSDTTRQLARELAQNLGCYFTEIDIEPSVTTTLDQLSASDFVCARKANYKLSVSEQVLENIQARDRSSRILAAVAAAFGGVFTCNANKSEMTIGYSTLYGDLGGYLANIADLWKGEVYDMAQFINDQIHGREVIPQGTLDVVPSAELSAAQDVDTGQGDPLFYPYHDALFKSWVEHWERATPEENLQWYMDGVLEEKLGYRGDLTALFSTPEHFMTDLERWWRLYQGMAVAKRIQAPPVLAVKQRTFGFDHREAQLGPRFSEGYFALKQQVLAQQ